MTARRPVWLATDASPALALRRPLRHLARPAAGRTPGRQVSFAVGSPALVDVSSRHLAATLAHTVGPTGWGQVVVETYFTHEAVTRALSAPLLQRIPVARLNHVLAMYDDLVAQTGSGVLLVASCAALWPQTHDRARLS